MIKLIKNRHSTNRRFEWYMSVAMIGIALTIIYDPRSLSFGGFAYMTRIGLTAPVLGFLFLFGGIAGVAALYANGLWPVMGPRIRAARALGAAVVWAQMCVALFEWSTGQDYLSLGVTVYLILAVGEIDSVIRAAQDVNHIPTEVANGRSDGRS